VPRSGSRFRPGAGAARSALGAGGVRAFTTLEARGVATSAPAAPESESPLLGVGVGEIHVIMGPMFAGKTTALLERVARAEADGLVGPDR